MTKMLREMYQLKIPIYITENGMAGVPFELRSMNGRINDERRIRYIREYLRWIEKGHRRWL